MKSYRKMTAIVLLSIVFLCIVLNIYLWPYEGGSDGRMYRVEIARIAKNIRENGFEQMDLSECQYVTHVERCGADEQGFYEEVENDYLIRQIDGELYRFDYTDQTDEAVLHMRRILNLGLGGMAVFVVFLLLYIQHNIIKPFERLKEVPFELAKGNLTIPLKEHKSRFFGRFLWGIDLLREHLEEQHRRELKLQKTQKTLTLSISHDIKTPLSAIKLYAKMIEKGMYQDAAKAREIAQKINEKSDEIEMFVSQLHQAVDEDSLQMEVMEGEFYLSQLVNRTAAYYKDKLGMYKTKFLVGEYDDCMLRGDLDRSIEVLQNMMENAVKYGDGDKIALEFAKEEDCILVTVKNSGCTLPASELGYIFDSFWRGSNAIDVKGSGLGLYICRQIMQQMGGEVFAVHQGTDMCVTAVFRKCSLTL